MWFIPKMFSVDFCKVREVFIDATYGVTKSKVHLYAIIGDELGYGVPLGFMIVEIHPKEDERTKRLKDEMLECNRHFYKEAKEMGINPEFVHTDKDFSEITAVCHQWDGYLTRFGLRVAGFSLSGIQ
jgi:hypothetical protein